MISAKTVRAIVLMGVVAAFPVAPAAARDASFPCKVLLCGLANWAAIPYCAPIMQQAMWLNYLRISVGICTEAGQNTHQNHNDSSGWPTDNGARQAGNPGAGSAPLANCPSGSVPMTMTNGRYSVDFGGALCGKPLTSEARTDLAGCANSALPLCSKIFTAKDVAVNQPLPFEPPSRSPAQ